MIDVSMHDASTAPGSSSKARKGGFLAAPLHPVVVWNAARRSLSRALKGDVLDKESYSSFISYRHEEPDRKWAIWLHSALESYVIPAALRKEPNRRRIGRVFRDEEELAASAHLSEDIRDALRRSEWLIVVCSPRSKASQWVDAEIRYFRELSAAIES